MPELLTYLAFAGGSGAAIWAAMRMLKKQRRRRRRHSARGERINLFGGQADR